MNHREHITIYKLQIFNFFQTCSNIMFFINVFVGPVAQWKRIRLRIWGLQVRSLPGSSFYIINNNRGRITSTKYSWFLFNTSINFQKPYLYKLHFYSFHYTSCILYNIEKTTTTRWRWWRWWKTRRHFLILI